MLIKQIHLILLFAFSCFVNSCNHKDKSGNYVTDSNGNLTAIRLLPKEIKRAGIEFGSLNEQTTDRWIPCSGYLVVSTENVISICSPADGIITSVYYSPGSYIKTGSVIAGLENISFIKLQQEYFEATNQFQYLREDYKRQGELTVENATSIKKLQSAQTDFQSAELRMNSLRLQLEVLGIDPDSLKVDHLTSVIPIKNYRYGKISSMKIYPGAYVKAGEVLCELINSQPLILKLFVHEQYISSLEKGQQVNFYLPYDSLSVAQAHILSKADKIDPVSHTAEIYAEMVEPENSFVPGMSVRAKIKILPGVVLTADMKSVLHHSSQDYMFAMKNGYILRIPVKVGATLNEKTELLNFPLAEIQDSIVIQGIDYLNSLFER